MRGHQMRGHQGCHQRGHQMRGHQMRGHQGCHQGGHQMRGHQMITRRALTTSVRESSAAVAA